MNNKTNILIILMFSWLCLTFQLKFEGTVGNGIRGDIAIDDVSVRQGNCTGPPSATDTPGISETTYREHLFVFFSPFNSVYNKITLTPCYQEIRYFLYIDNPCIVSKTVFLQKSGDHNLDLAFSLTHLSCNTPIWITWNFSFWAWLAYWPYRSLDPLHNLGIHQYRGY